MSEWRAPTEAEETLAIDAGILLADLLEGTALA